MGSLYFSGRATSAATATTFLDIAQDSAKRQKLQVDRTGGELVVHTNSGAEPMRIEFDDRLLFEGSIKPAEGESEGELRSLVTLFAEAHSHLDAFLLVDDEDNTLFEHGDVPGMEKQLDEALEEKTSADMVLDETTIGPLDTKWFTNCRVFVTSEATFLQISLDARSRVNDDSWAELENGIRGLRGVTAITPASEVLGFKLDLDGAPTEDDTRRFAIATSFMLDDAIAATRASDTPGPRG